MPRTKINKNGKLTDQKTREKIQELIESLVAWTRKMKAAEESSMKREERKAA